MIKRRTFRLELPSCALTLGERTLLMGVLNVTPDSFSDGGEFLDPQRAIEHALEMERAGADLVDIGGESTRPEKCHRTTHCDCCSDFSAFYHSWPSGY